MNAASGSVIETLSRLDDVLGETVQGVFASDAVGVLSHAELLALTRVAESLGRRVDALRIAVSGEIEERSRPELGEDRLSAQSGCMSAIDLLTRLTGATAATARARLQTARAVAIRSTLSGASRPPLLPVVREAFGAGSLGLDSAAVIARRLSALAERCDADSIAAAEAELVAAATGTAADGAPRCTADDTRLQAEVWALVLDPDGSLPDDDRAARRRSLVLGRERDGLVPLSGALLPDVAEQLRRLVDAHLNPRIADRPAAGRVSFRPASDDEADGGGDHGGGDHGGGGHAPGDDPLARPHDPRTRVQKQHDVLASVLGVAARAAETPALGGAAPTLLVTISADELPRGGGIGFLDGSAATVPAFVARQIACGGGAQRLVLSPDGRIVELGSPQRTFTPQQRRAIAARDGGCVIPGCHVAASWCEIHHVIEAARGGPTHTDNGVLLCWWHHRSLGSSGWEVRLREGIPEVRAPAPLDPGRRWRRAPGSLRRQRDRLRRKRDHLRHERAG